MAARAVCHVPKMLFCTAANTCLSIKWNMLVGGRMIENRRPVAFHHSLQLLRVGNISDLGMKCHAGKVLSQLSIDLKEWGLGLIESDQSKRTETCNLSAELRSD